MYPTVPAVTSVIWVTRDTPLSCIVILSLSEGFMSNVLLLGVNEASVAVLGPGGPVGTPSVWISAKLTGSVHWGLQWAKPDVHSRLSMVRAAHQWVESQLTGKRTN